MFMGTGVYERVVVLDHQSGEFFFLAKSQGPHLDNFDQWFSA
jgi:hypothetical protein